MPELSRRKVLLGAFGLAGAPGVTQAPIGAGTSFTYEFTVPDPGTYFYHPHSGVQLDRGLYGVLLVDERADPDG